MSRTFHLITKPFAQYIKEVRFLGAMFCRRLVENPRAQKIAHDTARSVPWTRCSERRSQTKRSDGRLSSGYVANDDCFKQLYNLPCTWCFQSTFTTLFWNISILRVYQNVIKMQHTWLYMGSVSGCCRCICCCLVSWSSHSASSSSFPSCKWYTVWLYKR